METYRCLCDTTICAEEQPMGMVMSIAICLIALGIIGLGVAMVNWHNDRKGL